MANYTLTSSAVLHSVNAGYANYTAGATIAAGQPVYVDPTALDTLGRAKVKLADANASATTASTIGIAANSASNGQPIRVVSSDTDFTHGLSTVAIGDIIIVSATAGSLAPSSDMATGMFPSITMVATSATKAVVAITNGLAAKL